jgi:uncharacterized protein (DUF2461 family)
MSAFAGFGPGVHDFFAGLQLNNSRDYFAAHRAFFEAAIRDAVDDETAGPRLAALAGAAQHSGLELWGQSLTTAPRGYAVDHARIELLRRKSLALGATRPCPDGVARDDALGFVADTWRAAAPVTAWLDAHVGPSTLELDRGRRRR